MKIQIMIGAILSAVVSMNAHSDWYEATGQAFIQQGNTAQARQTAIDDAIKRASLVAGAKISSSQLVQNGVLQNERFNISSQGEIKQLQLISESHNGNLLTVTVRINIDADTSACVGSSYHKPLLLSQVQLQARQDAIYGQLFKLGTDITAQLERHLHDYSPAALVKPMTQIVTAQQLVYPETDRLFSHGNQYVLLATINDLSLGETTSKFWQKEQKERFFAINVSLYDLFEQHLVYQQEYRTSADWPYKSKSTPQSHSQAFWQLPYGQKIDRLLLGVAEDIQPQLQCKPLLSSIRQVKDNQIMLELGKMHGLRIGDELQLFQLQRHPTQSGVKRVIADSISLKITELTEQNAWASGKSELLQHIQQGDVVSVRKSTDF